MEEKNRSFLGEGGLKVVAVVVSCTLLNFIASKLMGYLDMPIYLDTIGTIVAAVLGGFMPGIVTAFFTNILNGYFDDLSVYYTILNAIIALSVAYLGKEGAIWKPVRMVQIILLMAFIGGIGGGVITWFLYGPSDSGVSGAIMHWLQTNLGLNEFFGHELAVFVLDLADKVLSFAAALLILRLIPQSFSDAVDSFGWQQAPMSTDQQERLKNQVWEGRHSIRSRVTWVLVVAIMLVAVAVTWVCMRTFSEYLEKEQLKTAEGMVNLAAAAIDPEMVDRYIEEGEDAPGYKDIEERLYEIRDETPDIKYVYIYTKSRRMAAGSCSIWTLVIWRDQNRGTL